MMFIVFILAQVSLESQPMTNAKPEPLYKFEFETMEFVDPTEYQYDKAVNYQKFKNFENRIKKLEKKNAELLQHIDNLHSALEHSINNAHAARRYDIERVESKVDLVQESLDLFTTAIEQARQEVVVR